MRKPADGRAGWSLEAKLSLAGLVIGSIAVPVIIAVIQDSRQKEPVVVTVSAPNTKALEDKLDKLAALPPGRAAAPPPPIHQAFQVTPTWFTNDLTVSLRKVATDSGGTLRLFACSRSSSRMSFVGEMAYAASQDSKSFTALFSEPFAVLLLQVDPSRGTPTSIIAPWDLKTQTRLKEPVSRPGVLNCNDIIGKF